MHPDLHTDLYNLDSVKNNLRHSAKGSLDAFDDTHSLTSCLVWEVASCFLPSWNHGASCFEAEGYSTRICRAPCGSRCWWATSAFSTVASSAQRTCEPTSATARPSARMFRRWRGRERTKQQRRETKSPEPRSWRKYGVLGADKPEAQSLVAALKQARAHSQSQSSIGAKLDSCPAFVERARKRLDVVEDVVPKAVSFKSIMESELEQGVARLQSLREEAVAQPPVANREHMQQPEEETPRPCGGVGVCATHRTGNPFPTHPATAAEEVNRVRTTVEELRRERISLMSEVARQSEGGRPREWKTPIHNWELRNNSNLLEQVHSDSTSQLGVALSPSRGGIESWTTIFRGRTIDSVHSAHGGGRCSGVRSHSAQKKAPPVEGLQSSRCDTIFWGIQFFGYKWLFSGYKMFLCGIQNDKCWSKIQKIQMFKNNLLHMLRKCFFFKKDRKSNKKKAKVFCEKLTWLFWFFDFSTIFVWKMILFFASFTGPSHPHAFLPSWLPSAGSPSARSTFPIGTPFEPSWCFRGFHYSQRGSNFKIVLDILESQKRDRQQQMQQEPHQIGPP